MTGADVNQVWSRTFLDELARCGVETVCLAPGSRSTPLVLAAAAHPGLRVVTHLDERCAAFFALGVGKATRSPAAVITTSGTAAANLLPAVVEASHSQVPLLLLTADRPHRLRGSDANQSIDQLHLYGSFVRSFVEVAPASAQESALRHLRVLAVRAVVDSSGSHPGPVHLNFPFDKPLEPADVTLTPDFAGAFGRPHRAPYTTFRGDPGPVPDEPLGDIESLLQRSRRAVLVAGPDPEPWRTGPAILGLAGATGLPLLADPLSGARYGSAGGATVVGAYDLFLRDAAIRARLAPDLVIRFGSAPVSAACATWLEESAHVPQVVVAPEGRWRDHLVTASHYVRCDAAAFCRQLADRSFRASGEWTSTWREGERAARAVLSEPGLGRLTEADVAAVSAAATPDGAWLFVSNSMPIRDVDAFAPPSDRSLTVLGNRGASGIDGVVSSALGVAAGSGRPVVALLGDLAFYHDMNGLLAAREPGVRAVIVVVHNDGGGIFHLLPIREFEPEFTRHFATPHGLDFRHVADLYDLPYVEVDTSEGLAAAIGAGLDQGSRIVAMRADREENRIHRERIAERVAGAVRDALNQDRRA